MSELPSTTSPIDELRASLAERVTTAELTRYLAPLIVSFHAPDTGADPVMRVKAYMVACEDFPPWAVEDAARDYIKGVVPDHTRKFMPTPAELANRARIYVHAKAAELEREKQMLSQADNEAENTELTPEERERRKVQVAERLKDFGITSAEN